MIEDQFVGQVTKIAKKILPEEYVPVQKENLYYQIIVDNNLEIKINLEEPGKGEFCIPNRPLYLSKAGRCVVAQSSF